MPHAPNFEASVMDILNDESKRLPTNDIVNVSKHTPFDKHVTFENIGLEEDDAYNHIDFSSKKSSKTGNFDDQMISDRRDNIKRFTNELETYDHASVQNDRDTFNTNCPDSEINPYFILEKYDQYDHLNKVQQMKEELCIWQVPTIPDTEYNEIRLARPANVPDPNYGVLSKVSSESTENDSQFIYSHLGDSDTKEPKVMDAEYSHI